MDRHGGDDRKAAPAVTVPGRATRVEHPSAVAGTGVDERVRRRSDVREPVLALADVAGLIAAFGLTLGARSLADRTALGGEEIAVIAAGIPLWVVIALLLGLYNVPERRLTTRLPMSETGVHVDLISSETGASRRSPR